MVEKNIAILKGDGIGPEIMQEAIKIIHITAEVFGHHFNYTCVPFGASAWKKENDVFPGKTKEICDVSDAILKGPVGDSTITKEIKDPTKSPEIGGILALRKRYDTYANYRPVILPKALYESSPLRKEIIKQGVNILMMRELVGGIYFGKKVEEDIDENGEKYALDECKYTENQVTRIAKVAFEEAQKRNVQLTNIHKSNVLATSRFWNKIVDNISKEFPKVKVNSCLVDAAAFYLVKDPTRFNGVMLLENMHGDILTDQGGGVLGSLGLMPSACINPSTKKGFYEPSHGSAPDIAGKGIANPYSQIGCVAMMFETGFDLEKEAKAIWNALHSVFEQGYRTIEIATESTPKNKIVSTSKFGDLVVKNIIEAGASV